jgi:hypothetical protein
MTPADYVAEVIAAVSLTLGYEVFTNHMPDKPDKAICIVDHFSGRTENRNNRTGEVDEHPTVIIVVRGTNHVDASGVLPTLWGTMRAIYRTTLSDGKIMHCVTKANTIGSLGQETQTRRVRYSQQFRMTLE